MTTRRARWFTVVGGVLLLVGLLTAFVSNHYASRVMGMANLGVAVYAPTPGSAEWQQKERLRARADGLFYVGLALTAFGVILQTIGAVVPTAPRVTTDND